MGVAAGDDEREQGEFHGRFGALAGLHEDGVDVAFEMIDADQRLVEAEAEGLGIGDADEQRSGEARAFGDGDGVEVGEGDWISCPAWDMASRTTGTMLRRCSREASSGTTPP